MKVRSTIALAIALLTMSASALGQQSDSLPVQEDENDILDMPAPRSIVAPPAGEARSDSPTDDAPAVEKRRDASERGLSLRQKRIFVLGLTKQESQ